MTKDGDNMDYLLGQAVSDNTAHTYSYGSEGHDQQHSQEVLPTSTPPTTQPPIDPTVAALLEQMQRMQTQQAQLQEKNAQLLQAALTRPISSAGPKDAPIIIASHLLWTTR